MLDAIVKSQGGIPSRKIQFPSRTVPDDLYFNEDKTLEIFIRYYDSKESWRIFYQPTDPDDLQYIL